MLLFPEEPGTGQPDKQILLWLKASAGGCQATNDSLESLGKGLELAGGAANEKCGWERTKLDQKQGVGEEGALHERMSSQGDFLWAQSKILNVLQGQ